VFDPTNEPGKPNASLARIVIEPDQATITSNDSLDVAAFGLTSTGDTVDVDVTWTAVTGSVTGKGKGRGRALGRYKPARLGTDQVVVRASASQLSDTALVTVIEPAAASVTLSLSSAALAVDSTVQLTATVKDVASNTLSGKTVTWSSSRSSVATVDAAGLVRGVAAGSATISATSDGVSGSASISVSDTEPAAASVTLSPSNAALGVDNTVQLTATAQDAAGNTLPGKTVTWSSSNSSAATVDTGGLVRGVAAGSATISGTSDGVSGSASITVSDTGPAVAAVTVSPSSTALTVGSTVQLTATVKDAAGNTLSDKTVAWSSSRSSVATVDATGLVRGVAAGSVTISATSDGVSGTAAATVTEPSVAAVTVSPSSTSITVGSMVQLTATVRDAAGNTLSGKTIAWSSSNSAVATVDGAGLVRAAGAGSATISATSDGVSGSAAVTVTEPSVASVTVSPSSASVAVGSAVQLTATVKDGAGNTLSGKTVTWSSSNSSLATVDAAGLVRGVAAGSVTVTATSDGVAGTSTITVTQGGGPTNCNPLPGVLPVFPGAEGYGTTTPAGRCGQVIRVTNLDDAGPGSLRAALLTPGPRQVIFEVSGQINLQSAIDIGGGGEPTTYGNLSVYGQTAPSPGITIAGETFAIRSSDVLIQHLRFRHGNMKEAFGRSIMAMSPGTRVVIDHVSASWASDDNTGIWAAPLDVTWSNSISSESNRGMLIGQGSQRISVIRNLFAHTYGRTPAANGGTNVVWVNNLLYNCGFPSVNMPIRIWSAGSTELNLASVLGTVTKDGPTNGGVTGMVIGVGPGSKIFLDDNVFTRVPGVEDVTGTGEYVSSPPYPLPSPLTVLPNSDLEGYIVANVGARPADRDPVDTRIINDVANGTGRHIKVLGWGNEDENVVGGFPSLAQNTRVLTLPPNPHGDDDGDGYTNLEEWIHQFTAQVEGRN
jgi:uncharacterized protein YjdB